MEGTFTLEFYGEDCENNATNFINLKNSQGGKDAQKSKSITVFDATSVNSLRQQIGKRYFDRYEVEIMIQYSLSSTIDTLNITSIELTYEQN